MGLKFLGLTDDEKSHLRVLVSSGRFSREIRMAYYHAQRTNSLYKEPAILSGITSDIYIAPISYATGRDIASLIFLKKGDEGNMGDITVKYIGQKDSNRKAMMEGMPEVFINLEITHRNMQYHASPGFRILANGQMEYRDAFFSSDKRKISLKNVNPETKEALIFIEPAKDASEVPDELIVEITYKRLIILVWTGTVLIAVGLFLAFWRVRK
jgi:hypothetical protein